MIFRAQRTLSPTPPSRREPLSTQIVDFVLQPTGRALVHPRHYQEKRDTEGGNCGSLRAGSIDCVPEKAHTRYEHDEVAPRATRQIEPMMHPHQIVAVEGAFLHWWRIAKGSAGRETAITLNFSLRAPHSAPRISLHHNPQSASLFDDVQGRGAGRDTGGGNPVNPRVLHHLRRRERFGQPFGFDGKIICFTAGEQI